MTDGVLLRWALLGQPDCPTSMIGGDEHVVHRVPRSLKIITVRGGTTTTTGTRRKRIRGMGLWMRESGADASWWLSWCERTVLSVLFVHNYCAVRMRDQEEGGRTGYPSNAGTRRVGDRTLQVESQHELA